MGKKTDNSSLGKRLEVDIAPTTGEIQRVFPGRFPNPAYDQSFPDPGRNWFEHIGIGDRFPQKNG
jgi:hypothetical protein